jgi:putative ABC transport system substrate-binding protein
VYRQAGIYVGRILKGEKPSDLPVVRAGQIRPCNKSENQALDLVVLPSLLVLADEVFE